MESNSNSAFVKNDKIEGKPVNKNSLSSFLAKSSQREPASSASTLPLSLFTTTTMKYPSITTPNPNFSGQMSFERTPSLLKQESQSEYGINDTPVPLPADTPAIAMKNSAPSSTQLQIFNTTPSAIKKEESKDLVPRIPGFHSYDQSTNFDREKFEQTTGMNLDAVNSVNQISNMRKPQEEPTLQNIVSTVDLK